jgi:hypothetical protein
MVARVRICAAEGGSAGGTFEDLSFVPPDHTKTIYDVAPE